jgi:hypothetical protein
MTRKALPGDPAAVVNHARQSIPSGPKVNRNAMMKHVLRAFYFDMFGILLPQP